MLFAHFSLPERKSASYLVIHYVHQAAWYTAMVLQFIWDGVYLFVYFFVHSSTHSFFFSSSQAVWLLQIFCFLSLVTATSCHIADPPASTAVLRKHILSRIHLFFWTSCHWRKIFILTSSGHRACRYKLCQFLIFSLLSSTLLQGTTFVLKSDFWLTSEVLLILSR